MTEDELLQGLLDACYVGGWLVHHVRRSDLGLQQGHAGFPDIVAVHPERREMVAWEVKTQTGRLTALQDAWLDGLRRVSSEWMSVETIRPNRYDWAVRFLIGERLLAARPAIDTQAVTRQ